MLISDILREEEDDEFCTRRTMKKKTKIPIPSPRWPPLRSFLRSRSSGKVAGDDPAPPPPLPAEVEEGGNPRERIHLGIGMGAGLVLLLTRSGSELSKMAELRKEMESLMEDCKAAIQKNNQNPNPNPNLTSCGGSDSRAETEQSNLTDDGSHGGDAERRRSRRSLKREEMEAELESELELLHINLAKQEWQVSGEGSAPSGSSTAGLEPEEQGEEEEEEEEPAMEIPGVSPRALTRKLHELLERRQRERIEELESDLELARAKLREKEMEISLWREMARVVSQRAASHIQRIT